MLTGDCGFLQLKLLFIPVLVFSKSSIDWKLNNFGNPKSFVFSSLSHTLSIISNIIFSSGPNIFSNSLYALDIKEVAIFTALTETEPIDFCKLNLCVPINSCLIVGVNLYYFRLI